MFRLALALLLALYPITATAEKLALESPVTSYKIGTLILNWPGQYVRIDLIGDDGSVKSIAYDGPQALALLNALSKADLSVESLQKRLLDKLVIDNKVKGSVSVEDREDGSGPAS